MLLAFYVHHWDPFILQLGENFGIRWYGASYVAAFVVGYWLLKRFARRGYSQLPEGQVDNLIAAVALWGVLLGGRLGYALFYDFNEVLHNPARLLQVWHGGMASHGGILGVVLVTLWFARRHKVTWTGLGDNLVVAAPIGIFFGRLANFINGELYGRATSVPWAMQFPQELLESPKLAGEAALACVAKVDPALADPEAIIHASLHSQQVRDVLATILTPRHPSQLYAALLEGLCLFLILWFLRTKTRVVEGVVTGAFFLAYAALRIFGEQFREPDPGVAFTLGLTRGQFLSLFLIMIGIGFIVVALRRGRPSPRPGMNGEGGASCSAKQDGAAA